MSAMQTISDSNRESMTPQELTSSPKLMVQPAGAQDAAMVAAALPKKFFARRGGAAAALTLTPADRDRLTRWTRAATAPRRLVTRSLVVLMAADGCADARIAMHLRVTRATVARWKTRFVAGGSAALLADAPGRGRKRGRDPQIVARVLRASAERPPHGQSWSVRSLARLAGVSHATVQRVWREHGVAPAPRGRAIADEPRDRARHAISETAAARPALEALAVGLRKAHASLSSMRGTHATRDARIGHPTSRKVTA
jgi:transposase